MSIEENTQPISQLKEKIVELIIKIKNLEKDKKAYNDHYNEQAKEIKEELDQALLTLNALTSTTTS